MVGSADPQTVTTKESFVSNRESSARNQTGHSSRTRIVWPETVLVPTDICSGALAREARAAEHHG